MSEIQLGSGRGSKTARFMIVGEAWGAQEEAEGEAFVGPSGKTLGYMLERAGMEGDVWITNVVNARPPGNDISKWCPRRKRKQPDGRFRMFRVPSDIVGQGLWSLYRETAEVGPKVIIPVGNTALWAFTGQEDISRRRGSIYEASIDTERALIATEYATSVAEVSRVLKAVNGTKVIPTYHPAAVLRQYTPLKPLVEFDLRRARAESRIEGLCLPEREIFVDPPREQAEELATLLLKGQIMGVDIETPGGRWYCTAYCIDPSWALVLRTSEPWQRELHRMLLESPVPKVFQNGCFDTAFLLYHEHIDVQCFTHDTMYAHKLMHPEFKQGLDLITSLHTREPYYKDEGKNHDLRLFDSELQYLRYNGKDACVTLESWLDMQHEIAHKPQHKRAIASHERLHYIARDMMVRGIRVDMHEFKRLRHVKKDEQEELQAKLDDAVAADLLKLAETHKDPIKRELALQMLRDVVARMKAGTPGFNVSSNKDVMGYLYTLRGFPVKRNKKTKRPTCDEAALKELYGETGDPSLLLMCKVREVRKLRSSYLSYKFAPNGRFMFSVNPVATKTQRWSSGQTIIILIEDHKKPGHLTATGANGMTLPPEFRSVIVPDKGYILGYFDLSGVEDRIVAYAGGVRRKIQAFESGLKPHGVTAAGIFGKSYEEVMEEAKRCKAEGKEPPMYYMGKQSNHAYNYGEGPRTFMLNVNKKSDQTGIRITFAQSKAIRTGHFRLYPEIISGYWSWIEEQVRATRKLRNCFGYERDFHGRLDDATMRDAYSWYPQTVPPEIINRSMVRIKEADLGDIQLLLHVHDAILLQVPEKEAEALKPEIVRLMDEPLDIRGHVIHIPVDGKFGERWSKIG